MSGAEEPVGGEGGVALSRHFSVTAVDGDGGIVAAYGIAGAGAIPMASGVLISTGSGAMGLTGEWGGDVQRVSPRSQQGGCLGHHRANHSGLAQSEIETSRGSYS